MEVGGIERLAAGLSEGPAALVADARVAGIHGAVAQLALGRRLSESHELPAGEEAKTLEAVAQLWRALRLPRSGTLVALGGGSVTDAAGFVAATYLRGIPWVAVPTTLVGQVDAGIGGKTAIDLPEGKNLVGAFHWPDENGDRPRPARDASGRGAQGRHGRGREDRAPGRRVVLGASGTRSSSCAAPRSRPRSAFATLTSTASGKRSTSATRSRTRSRRRPTTDSATARPSRSACSRPCGSPACPRTSSRRSSRRGRRASIRSVPGPRSGATRRPRTDGRSSFCSSGPACRAPTWSCPRPTSEPRSTR